MDEREEIAKSVSVSETARNLREELDKLQEHVPEVTDDYHKLFLYFIGDQFEGIDPDKIKICDRSGDKKIDFYEDGEERFVVYQCKLPELDIVEDVGKIDQYGEDLINEAEDILTFLTDDSGEATGNKCVQEARNRYRARKEASEEDQSVYKLEVVIAYFGRLTKPAEEELECLKKRWVTDSDRFEIRTIDYETIASLLGESLAVKDRPKEIRLPIKTDTQVHTNTWAYALVPAINFIEYFEKYKMAIFDLNVRYYLENSHVNKEIIKTLNEEKGQKNFHLLNNGITVSCKNWRFPRKLALSKSKEQAWLYLYYPQIINGCQTVISLYRAYTQMKDEHKRRNFKDKCFVPVRIVNTQDDELLSEVVTASNNQNKMSARNLRSNSRYQRLLQRKFNYLKYPWFYERKDGEFSSLRGHPSKWFREKEYQFSKNVSRVVSNEDIAKSWLSFIGLSKDASEKINAFGFEENSRYETLFEMVPKDEHWVAISQGPQVEVNEENFYPKSPSPDQYLLSYIIFQFVKAYLPTPQANKKMCQERLEKSGVINKKTPLEELNSRMIQDEDFVLNQILYNMKEVVVELYSWILIKTYGHINENTAKALLLLPGLKDLYSNPNFKSYASALRQDHSKQTIDNILFTCFGFISEAVKRWYSIHSAEYQLHQRRIRFLHLAKTIQQLKQQLLDTNKHTRSFAYDWKPNVMSFLESLPKLPTFS